MSQITKVNVYRSDGQWCYAALIGDEHDHSDTLGIDDSATEPQALDEAGKQFPGANIVRVDAWHG